MNRMKSFNLIALTPTALDDPAIAIAACRSAETGVLDLACPIDASSARQAVETLSRFASRGGGVRFAVSSPEFVHELVAALPEAIEIVILRCEQGPGEADLIRRLMDQGRRVLLEVRSVDEARYGAELGVEGFVAKGNESGGWVGEETAFVLLQRLLEAVSQPVWVQGGVGLHTVAACAAAGAAGVVLDSQLLLTRESRLPDPVRHAVRTMDGSETVCVGRELSLRCRVYARTGGSEIVEEVDRFAWKAGDEGASDENVSGLRRAVEARVGWNTNRLWLVGQDAAFAEPLSRKYKTVAGVLAAMRSSVDEHLRSAAEHRPLREQGSLAQSHRTRYPVVQGPMTRVSDRAQFALEVARGGGLPFLALALMREPEVAKLLSETSRSMGELSWGVGILGFVPLELRQEQLRVIHQVRPPFALIAGGRPDQARSLEESGIATYLHVPSPGLLKLFLDDGARRFVFEGRECGGHVGPRSSFVLWNAMIDALLESLPDGSGQDCHVLFAGGIHDDVSGAMVAAMAAPLIDKGVKIGVLLGTAYLFTEEAVSSGAIVEGFQEEALRCENTVTLETGPGHATRCAPTPFAATFQQEKTRLIRASATQEEIRSSLEMLNLGRLRVASKGIDRDQRSGEKESAKYVSVDEAEQRERGMYMIGQVAALRNRTCSVEELHRSVSADATALLEELDSSQPLVLEAAHEEPPSAVAIIGMSCMLPKAPDLTSYWNNILNRVDAITEIPSDRWDWETYFDPDPRAKDKIYSKWGGFLDDQAFDPVEFGMPPNSLKSIDPMQLLALKAARGAMEDAGYWDRPYDRSQTSVILGASGGTGDLGASYLLRSSLPLILGASAPAVIEHADGFLPEWTEDSFAGLLLNVAAGRIANRFDFGGLNYVVDAACASSLAAVHQAVRELEAHATDMVLVGGVDTTQNPFGYLCFSKTHALSPTGRARTFDAEADGIAIAEGIVMLVLKRLEDAERDGDRIYAVIRGTAGSSDGRAKGMTAPRPEGQMTALRRAYNKAGFSPTTVELFEAHGTGTVVGDRTESLALATVLEEAGAERQSAAVGSVKTMIGHTKATAGVASLAKVALALHHKVLPPTLGVTKPNPDAKLDDGPLYVNTETRPWIGSDAHPRRAGASSFGFGGTNFHVALEEYDREFLPVEAATRRWPSELFVIACRAGQGRDEILAGIDRLRSRASGGAAPEELARWAWAETAHVVSSGDDVSVRRLAIVAESVEDLRQKLTAAETSLTEGHAKIHDARGIYYNEQPAAGTVAFLFPGQGSQYPNMMRDLAVHFAEVRDRFEACDRAVAGLLPERLSRYVFPPPVFGDAKAQEQKRALTETNVAQPALGAADTAMAALLKKLGVVPDMVAGHSYGEYVALAAAGVFDADDLFKLSEARGRSIIEAATEDLGTMAAADASPAELAPYLDALEDVWMSNFNAPKQTILSGSRQGIEAAIEALKAGGIQVRGLPVACAFHSPIVAPARRRLDRFLSGIELDSPEKPVYSNVTAARYPEEPDTIREVLGEHLEKPVRFADQVVAMYEAGARIFVEAGPRNVLTGLTGQILADRPHVAIATDRPGRSGVTQLLHGLGLLASEGVAVNLDRLFAGRVRSFAAEKDADELSPTTWLVNGGRVRPASQPEKRKPLPEVEVVLPSSESKGEVPPIELPRAATSGNGNGRAPATGGEEAQTAPRVMADFQRIMQRFLDTQQSVMQAYLAGSHPVARDVAESGAAPLEPSLTEPEPAVVAKEPSPTAAVPDESGYSREALEQTLLEVVSERTGYPEEMLDLDVDIEAELGIDSIKRVEILGTVQSAVVANGDEVPDGAMEELSGLKTLRGIVDWLDATIQGAPDLSKDPTVEAATERGDVSDGGEAGRQRYGLSRATLELQDRPLAGEQMLLDTTEGVLVVTDDGCGVADELARLVREQGSRAVIARTHSSAEASGLDVDLGDVESVSTLIHRVREQEGPIAGVVHLAPFSGLPPGAEPEHRAADVKGFFYLARAVGHELGERAASGLPAWCIAVVPHRTPESSKKARLSFPIHAGLRGIIKTLSLEWPAVVCRSIADDPAEPARAVASRVLAEITRRDPAAEVLYLGGTRLAPGPEIAPVAGTGSTPVTLGADSVVVLTGGARGITAEVAVDMAKRYRPTLALFGRSEEPPSEEAAVTRELSSPREIKAALISDAQERGESATLPAIEARYRGLLKEREIRATLERIREHGSRCVYRTVEIRDETEVERALKSVREAFGPIDVIVHGAGIIEDKLAVEKTPESFDRVFDTKVEGALALSKLVASDELQAFVLFGSAAGVFGNQGQCDYAAANEVLGELAEALNREWSGRVVAMHWGPWEKTGMVSAELRREFEKRGIELIPLDDGCRLFDEELRRGDGGDAQVVIAGGSWGRAEASAPAVESELAHRPALPMVRDAVMSNGGHIVRARRRLDPDKDLYLSDHQIDGVEVLPMAVATELMAEVAQQAWPEFSVVGVRDLHLLQGVVLEDGPRDIQVVARPRAASSMDNNQLGVDVHVEIHDPEERGQPYYRATVQLSETPLEPTLFEASSTEPLPPFDAGVDEAYRNWLFHGPLLHGIRHIEGLGERGVEAILEPSPPAKCVRDVGASSWLIDPVVFDSALQLFLIWSRANLDKTPLPSRFARFRRYAPIEKGPVYCHLNVLEKSRDPVFYIDLHFVGPDGRLLWVLEEMEGVSTKALNRLGGSWLVPKPGVELPKRAPGVEAGGRS